MKRALLHRNRFNRACLDQKAGARWGVLLWLLPYLVLSLFAGAPHSHGPNHTSGFQFAAAHIAAAHVAAVQPAAPAHEASESIKCALCVWASSSLATIEAPKSLHLARRGMVRGPPPCAVLLSASTWGRRNRGPPLS